MRPELLISRSSFRVFCLLWQVCRVFLFPRPFPPLKRLESRMSLFVGFVSDEFSSPKSVDDFEGQLFFPDHFIVVVVPLFSHITRSFFLLFLSSSKSSQGEGLHWSIISSCLCSVHPAKWLQGRQPRQWHNISRNRHSHNAAPQFASLLIRQSRQTAKVMTHLYRFRELKRVPFSCLMNLPVIPQEQTKPKAAKEF